MKKLVAVFLLTWLLYGCASIPDVTYKYYPAKWNTSVSVTQTVACNVDKTELLALHSVVMNTSYSADTQQTPFKIRIKDLQTFSADSDFTMVFTDDGRLKGINQSTTGQGETIVKSFVGLAASLAAAGTGILKSTEEGGVDKTKQVRDACVLIDTVAEKNKPLSLIYRTSVNASNLDSKIALPAAPESKAIYLLVQDVLPPIAVTLGKVEETASGPWSNETSDQTVWLELQKLGVVDLVVASSDERVGRIGGSKLTIPLKETYRLPIPKAALFGRQSFGLTLAESGAVTSVGYGRTVGVAGALNAMSSLEGRQASIDTAETAAMRAEADRIAQQQRLMTCLRKPADCK